MRAHRTMRAHETTRAHRAPARGRAGFTLVEMMVSLTVLGLLMSATYGVILTTQKDYTRQREVARAADALRTAQIAIATVLRSAGADSRNTGQAGIDPDPLSHGTFDNLGAKSDFNPADGDFADALEDVQFKLAGDTLVARWQTGGQFQPVAYPVKELTFSYYAQDGTLLTTAAATTAATRVKITIGAAQDRRRPTLRRIESWVFLRNRG